MPTLRTRAAKGSALSYTEGDDNLKRPVTQKTADYTLLVSDNRSIIECSHASTPITITLGAAATMAAAETGDYSVTIANINYAPVTIAPSGADTIEGSTQSIVLSRGQAVDLVVNSAGNGYINKNGRDKGENLFIGSNLTTNPWQRGTSTTVTTSNTYFADRFCLTFDGTANLTAEKVTLASPLKIMGQWCNNAMKITVNSSSGNTYLRLVQRVEDVTRVADQAAYLQTAIQGSAAFTVPLQLRRNYGTGGTPTSEETTAFDANLSVTTSLAVLSSGLVVPSLSSKTLGTDGLHTSYVAVEYDLINVPVGGHVIIPIAKFEAGSSGTSYQKEGRGEVLTGCQRYYIDLLTDGTLGTPSNLTSTTTSAFRPILSLPTPLRVEAHIATISITQTRVDRASSDLVANSGSSTTQLCLQGDVASGSGTAQWTDINLSLDAEL